MRGKVPKLRVEGPIPFTRSNSFQPLRFCQRAGP
jgi:hypothetical protein